MLRVVITDDEPLARVALRRALEDAGAVEIVAECENGQEAVDAVRTHAPDLLFLDIEMPEMAGFDVVANLPPEDVPAVVFVTAYNEYALRAFDVRALDYLVKPVSDDRLRETLERARAQRAGISGQALARTLRDVLDSMESAPAEIPAEPPGPASADYITRFTVKTRHGETFVRAEEVDWFEASGNYVLLHVGDTSYSLRITMSTLDERLDPQKFVRVHRSSIVNLDSVREVQTWFSGDYIALMKTGEQVRVSRNYKDDLLRKTF